jgi:hypothetical protein
VRRWRLNTLARLLKASLKRFAGYRMIDVKHDRPIPVISNDDDRKRVFSVLLAYHEDAVNHLNQCVTYPQKMRWAEQIEVYRKLSEHLCGQEIIG